MSDPYASDIERPPDPYREDEAVHIDDLPPFNGDRRAAFAFDDEGNRYRVSSGDSYPATRLVPERLWRETFMPEREGVGKPCAGCGDPIEWDAIIVNSEWHLGCYVDPGMDR